MILELAAFPGLAVVCAPGITPETLAAVARAESGFDTLAIGVNGRGGSRVRPERDEGVLEQPDKASNAVGFAALLTAFILAGR